MRRIPFILALIALLMPATALAQSGYGNPGGVQTVAPVNVIPTTGAPLAVSANTATLLAVANNKRIGLEVQAETAPTAVIYLCLNGQSNCSATVHDKIMPIGSAGVLYTAPFGVPAAIYVFSTAAVTMTATTYVAQ